MNLMERVITNNMAVPIKYDGHQLMKYALLVRYDQRFKEEVSISFKDRMRLGEVIRGLSHGDIDDIIEVWAAIHGVASVEFAESDDQLDQMIMYVLDEIWDKKGDAKDERFRKK
ncbi:hypothetical protein [Latilactobacillus curvatus]|uniref:hypothetical protein n=1 Tax=Latilactobacillus curvatus TaxID=28038 RepID=UPI00240F8A8D|nr:hypothetical protein [Latilactobacillus curvatus]MDG2980281.1 hypothetical protein [Latilactobacillus curvatus]